MLSTVERLASLMPLLECDQLRDIAVRLPLDSVRDDFSNSHLGDVRRLCGQNFSSDAWRDLISMPDFAEHVRTLTWLVVDVPQTAALNEALLQAIAWVKNLGWCRVLVLPQDACLAASCAWVPQLQALGFLLQGERAAVPWVMAFDVGCYKSTPDWLNARHWANPQLWDKHRW